MDNEPFSNPLAPPSGLPIKVVNSASEKSQPLTNDDFRKLMMTPRAVLNQSTVPGSVRGSFKNKHGRILNSKVEQNENVKKKKKINEIIRKQDGDILNELAKKYRDRAKERRDGVGSDGGRGSDMLSNTAYHAVGPDSLDMNAAERRKQLIQESKYLGGDMEHTHLVKGLDYALLQKVRAEIQSQEEAEMFLKEKEDEENEEEENMEENVTKKNQIDEIFDDQDRYRIKNKKVETLLKIVFNENLSEKNPLFIQGRMAFQYDLVSEYIEKPTTIIRSKSECPSLDAYNSTSTNEIILNKLIQIWTQIRMGSNKRQKKKLEVSNKVEYQKTSNDRTKFKEESIYDDIGKYIPEIKPKNKSSNSHYHYEKPQSYFETKSSKHEYSIEPENSKKQILEMAASVVGNLAATSNLPKTKKAKLNHQEPESYAECYPGAPENDDAILDSDDETDYKLKENSKKTTRWDNKEEYNDYDMNQETDSYQYGQKSNDNRKRMPDKKCEKAKLDREYRKINALISKKKQQGDKIGISYINEHYHSK